MEWVTQKEVEEAAKKSKRAAIACVKKHWKQLYTATEEEMREYLPVLSSALVSAHGTKLCALCKRYGNCKKCPLGIANYGHACSQHPVKQAADIALREWRKGIGSYSDCTKTAKAMYDKLCEL